MPSGPTIHSRTWSRRVVVGVLALMVSLFVAASAGSSAFAQGHEEEGANNLSFPVIWAEGGSGGVTLPGVFGEELFGGDYVTVDDAPWYLQGDALNVWQAGSMAAPADGAGGLTDVEVSTFDWGDNLEAKSWPLGRQSILRVESALYKTLVDGTAFPPMDTYPMRDVLADDPTPPEGAREEWATNGEQAPGTEATIYTDCARLKWDAAAGKWVGENAIDSTPVLMTAAGAELNQAGKVIFGTNWSMSGLTDGHYRITFYLDQACPNLNTFITSATQIAVSDEGELADVAAPPDQGGEPDMNGGIPGLVPADNLAYIDVQLGEPTYEPYVAPTPPQPAPTAAPPAETRPGLTPTPTPAATTRARKHVRLTLYRRYLSGHRVRFYGSVLPRHDGAKILLQRRAPKGYRTVARITLRPATKHRSQYRRTFRHAKAGLYRVVMPGDEEHLATTIGTVRVRAR